MGAASKPPGKAMYVAPRPDWDWLRIEQRALYTRSEQQVDSSDQALALAADAFQPREAALRTAAPEEVRELALDAEG